jgi:NADPH2:quinone reductase
MKAIAIDRCGGPDVLELREVSLPEPAEGEVRIRVHTAGVNFGDTVVRAGGAPIEIPFPLIPGSEVVGVVDCLGPGVEGIPLGSRVAGPLFLAGRLGGGYAEYATIPADLLVPLPEDIQEGQAATLLLQGLTALLLLRQTPVQGKTVLVHAAAGGVGSLALQLARLRGASAVIATAGSEEKLALASRLGATSVVNYRDRDWPEKVRAALDGHGPGIIFDSVGGEVRRQSLELLAPLGVLVLYGGSVGGGYASDHLEAAQVAQLMMQSQSVTGFSLWPLLSDRATIRNLTNDCYAELFALVQSRQLETVIGTPYPLADAREAHRSLEARETIGKILLQP